jgi:hypothetical protein
MTVRSYSEIRSDVASIAAETVTVGGSIEGGLGRAMVEYWMEPWVLLDPTPVPLPIKVAVAIAVCGLLRDHGLPVGAEDEAPILKLLPALDRSDFEQTFNTADISAMRAETLATFSPTLYRVLSDTLASERP